MSCQVGRNKFQVVGSTPDVSLHVLQLFDLHGWCPYRSHPSALNEWVTIINPPGRVVGGKVIFL